jgi:DNA replication protein DnaC
MVDNSPSMQSSDDTWKEVLERIREKASEENKLLFVAHPHGGGVMVESRKKTAEQDIYADTLTPEEKERAAMKWSGVPSKYGLCSFENFMGNIKIAEYLKSIAYSNENIVLTGGPGCGKTHLAVAMMRHTGSGKFITVPDLLLKIRDTFNSNERSLTEQELIDSYSSEPFLVLDDLGAEKSTEYSITTLYLIINRRINEERKTLITTNLSLQQISESLGERIASRLSGMNIVKINMPDYRKKR